MKKSLVVYLSLMAALIGGALAFPEGFRGLMEKPQFYPHAKFIHVLSATLFFANAVLGTLWETKAFIGGDPAIIRYTYRTVIWLDSIFTAPLILLSVTSGIMLATILGGVWSMGWVSAAFLLFIFSGLVWVVADIPMQYRINRLFSKLSPDGATLPPELKRILFWRIGVNFLGTFPLLLIFVLMIYKPSITFFASSS